MIQYVRNCPVKPYGPTTREIFEVEQDSFSIPWSLQAVQRELESERALYYVLEQEDGTIVGYAGLWQVLDEGQITNIALRKEFRHQGYGELLVRV